MMKSLTIAVAVLLLAATAQAAAPKVAAPPPPSMIALTFSYSSSFSDVCDSNSKVDDAKVAGLVDVLIGDSSVTASNINFIGNCKCAGLATMKSPHYLADTFSKPVVILATGQAKVAVKEQNAVMSWSTFMNQTTINKKAVDSGDDNIEADVDERLGEEVRTFDACGIEFDLNIPKSLRKQNRKSTNLVFPYVFASEEYLEYSNPAFGKSDQFGFYIGAEKTNVAKFQVDLGGGYKSDPTLVTCDNINPDSYPELFVPNTNWKMSGSGQEHEVAGDLAAEWDGMTTKLITQHYSVSYDKSVPMKLIIADVDDNRVDSAVYIQGGIAICGDGVVQEGEECDDGNDNNYDGCNNWCKPSKCLEKEGACGDPHIESFDGADFMFTGVPEATFNMLSHPSYQINTYFRKYRKQDASKTWIGAVGMMVGANDKIEVTGVKKGEMVVKVNGVEMAMNSVQNLANTKVAFSGEINGDKDVTITTPDMVVVIEISAENWNLDFEVERISMDLGSMHGILGQSYVRMLEQRSAIKSGKTVPRPVSGVEGEEMDYKVASGLFGTDFKYNKFQGAAIDASASKAVKTGASSARKALEVSMIATHAGSETY